MHEPCSKRAKIERCCCNCRWLLNVMKHPDNPINLGYGKVTETMGYACYSPEIQDEGRRLAIFVTTEHGLCEAWERRG